jgi:hypothetical protein
MMRRLEFARRPQRLRRALRLAGLRARIAVFVLAAADLFVFAISLLASFRPDGVVTIRLAAELCTENQIGNSGGEVHGEPAVK